MRVNNPYTQDVHPMLRALSIAILTLAAAGCTRVSDEGTAGPATPTTPATQTTPATKPGAATDRVIVYYFHATRRCRTCLGIQATIQKTINERFSAELASGTVSVQEVNIELPENKHFVKDYNVSFSSMIVVAHKGQTTLKWENCEKIWPLAHNEPELTGYVEQKIRAYLQLVKGS